MKISNYLILILFCLVSFQAIGQDTLEQAPEITEVINETIKSVTGNENAEIKMPDTFDPTNPDSVFEWWMFIYGALMPIGLYVFHRFFPSVKKSELILKSIAAAIVVLIIVLASLGKGGNILTIGQGVIALMFNVFTYNNFYKSIGKSPRKQSYDSNK